MCRSSHGTLRHASPCAPVCAVRRVADMLRSLCECTSLPRLHAAAHCCHAYPRTKHTRTPRTARHMIPCDTERAVLQDSSAHASLIQPSPLADTRAAPQRGHYGEVSPQAATDNACALECVCRVLMHGHVHSCPHVSTETLRTLSIQIAWGVLHQARRVQEVPPAQRRSFARAEPFRSIRIHTNASPLHSTIRPP
jgi:hypothetical protein